MAICLVSIIWVNELYYLSSYKWDIINDAIHKLDVMKYTDKLRNARTRAKDEFFAQNPLCEDLIEIIIQTIEDSIISIEKNCILDNYTRGLLASFIRTSAASVELVITSELIEASALSRKQFELIARLRELEINTAQELDIKTPNLKNLKGKLKTLYSEYSESAHSSTFRMMSLLGFYKKRKRENPLSLPEFTENTELTFQHWVHIYFEFTLWALDFKDANIMVYDKKDDEEKYSGVYKSYMKTGLETKFK